MRRLASFVSMVGGSLLISFGATALARSNVRPIVQHGPGADTLYTGHVSVFGLHATRLGAIIAIAAGAVLLLAGVGTGRDAGKGTLRIIGAVAAVWGLVQLGGTFHGTVGSHAPTGILFIVLGAVVFVSALPRRRRTPR